MYNDPNWTNSSAVERARQLAIPFAERAPRHDRAGTFPHENYADLRKAGFAALTVPTRLGGEGASLIETIHVLETLAAGDGSTALGFAMHAHSIGLAEEEGTWSPALFEKLCRAAVARGALVNSVASEPELGSPSRGGRPRTTATPHQDASGSVVEWVIAGRKSWASLSPTLDYLIITAAVEDGSERVARFLAPMGPSVEIIETWDSMGMRGTASHDLVFHDLHIPADHLILYEKPAHGKGGSVNAWFQLCLSAVYLGIAQGAIAAATNFAWKRVPTALGKPIAEVEAIQRQIGQAAFAVQQARMVLHYAAERWCACPDLRPTLGEDVSVAKVTATNQAVHAVDLCMRVVGGASMSRSLPLERFYRDVRAGLNHPIQDDVAYLMLGRNALRNAKPEA